jgi:hypothetical protein
MKKVAFYCEIKDEKDFYKTVSKVENKIKKDLKVNEVSISSNTEEENKVGFVK